MDITNVAVIGMGAVGSAVSSYLYATYNNDFYVIAKDKRAQRIRQKGICVNHVTIRPQVIHDKETCPNELDLVIVCVKNYSLEEAMNDLEGIIHEHTILLPLLNGVTAVDKLKERFPRNRVLYGIILRTDADRVGHTVTFSTTGEIQIGCSRGEDQTSSLAVCRFLKEAGLHTNVYEDMKKMLWRKWMINIGCNQVSVAAEAEFLYFKEVPEIVELMRILMDEIVSIAKAESIDLTTEDRDEVIQIILNYPPHKKTSMLQDIQSMRKTEIDYFAGTVVTYGKKHGIPTPYNYALYLAIKSREQVYLYKKTHGFELAEKD